MTAGRFTPAKVILGTGTALFASWMVSPQLFEALFVLLVVRSVMLFLQKIGLRITVAWLFFGVGSLTILVLAYRFPNIQLSPYLAITSINMIVAFAFGNRLVRGTTPILIQFVKQHDGGTDLPLDFAVYLKNQCLAWTGFGLISAILGLVAIFWAPTRGWVNNFLITLLIIQALWFVVTHKIAQYRFSRPETWTGTLRLILHQNTWKNLEF